MKQAKKKRFRYFVDKPFQTKFILNFVILVLISALFSLGFILYIDSQKFSRGVLFEELVKDFYKTTDLSVEALKIKNNIQSLGLPNKEEIDKIIGKIDRYINSLKDIEASIINAIETRKWLTREVSLVYEDGFFYRVSESIKDNKVNPSAIGISLEDLKSQINRYRIDIEIGIQECEFDKSMKSLEKISSILVTSDDIERSKNFKSRFSDFKNSVLRSFEFIRQTPDFLNDVEKLLSGAYSQGMFDDSILSSISSSISKIKGIIGSVREYKDVLYYETRTYGKKAYNLLDLYWRPILALSILQIILISAFGLFFSHRIAGPVHRIKRELREIADGKLPINHEIKLRKRDFLLDIAKEINNTLKSISEKYNIK
ncbi:MAG: hypothetical protein RMJ37_06110 [Spirochaetia bacterium]|nr:hypothetical protein [Spirochaetota bacterium]MDW8112887.1 hypothetical protein [Spirochaetia bacterium]